MKRKVLACITACALAVCCFVPVSFANETPGVIDTQDELVNAINSYSGDPIDLKGENISLESTLKINNKNVAIENGTLTGPESGNAVDVINGADVSLNKVTIISKAKHALNVWGNSNLTASNLTLNHDGAASGAPAVVSNGSTATFSGKLTLILGSNSWYGINADNSNVDVSGAEIYIPDSIKEATQSILCAENNGIVIAGNTLTKVVTDNDGGSNIKQTAYVNDENLAQFVNAKKDKNVSQIELTHDVKLSEPLNLYNATKVIGNGNSIIGPDGVKDNVVTVWEDGTALNDLTIKTTASNKSALHLYKASATLTNVTLDNQETVGGAGMVVNGGKATIVGKLNILLGANSWGGVNIDDQYGNSGMEFADGSTLTLTSPSNQDAIYIDRDEDNSVTVIGADKAGLEQDADGNYIIAKTEEPTDPSQPGDKPSQDEDKTPAADADKEAAADSPKTGDESASYGLLIALMLCSGAGIYALKRNAK